MTWTLVFQVLVLLGAAMFVVAFSVALIRAPKRSERGEHVTGIHLHGKNDMGGTPR